MRPFLGPLAGVLALAAIPVLSQDLARNAAPGSAGPVDPAVLEDLVQALVVANHVLAAHGVHLVREPYRDLTRSSSR
jgi:hypothetical protein